MDGAPSRLGVISDVHNGVAELEVALTLLDGHVDAIWCAGDIVLEYRFCSRTVGLLREYGVRAIQGNHDAVLLGPAGSRACRHLPPDDPDLAWLSGLPREISASVGGRRVFMTHGNPWLPHGDYLAPYDRRWLEVDQLGHDVVLTGHTHLPMAERFGATLVVNPGSLSEPRQHGVDHGSFAVVDLVAGTADVISLGGV